MGNQQGDLLTNHVTIASQDLNREGGPLHHPAMQHFTQCPCQWNKAGEENKGLKFQTKKTVITYRQHHCVISLEKPATRITKLVGDIRQGGVGRYLHNA